MHFNATIEKGQLAIERKTKWRDYLLGFTDGTKMVVEIDRRKNKRSLTQNSFYWLYLTIIADETGEIQDDLHEYFKRKFLPPIEKKILGQVVRLPGSTTDLSKFDFGEYLDKICAMTNVPIPDPEDAGYISNHKSYLEK